MKIRILSLVCVASAATLLAGCAVYKNPSACEQLMRSKLADSSTDTLKIDHAGTAIDGTRVVVEGTIEHVMTASEVAAATPPVVPKAAAPVTASAAQTGQMAYAASGVRAASAASAASSTSASASESVAIANGSGASETAVAAPAAMAEAASSAGALSAKDAKPKKTTTAAAAECTFHGETLGMFTWLAPAKLAAPPEEAAEE
ncbi:hypothetical protein NDK50_13865 [Paraburkholderia bryophila]|uniref:hypothetical protein n=1 Tax=Paraburkholderia bryophila TaxID=420952 RepID=UPI00234B0EE6|nr:hypothetical protein [Paraburkholderia bryophila]WCM18533.1 hypothetical protein NDK50_13865 [Paraburkholderia bryophila]